MNIYFKLADAFKVIFETGGKPMFSSGRQGLNNDYDDD